jgi:hypothetical protein
MKMESRFFRRTIILGSSICAASVVSGVAFMFWREYRQDLPAIPSFIALDLLVQSTASPLYVALAWLWPITLCVLLASVAMVYIASRWRRMWLSVTAFLLVGVYWLWMVKLISDGAFD